MPVHIPVTARTLPSRTTAPLVQHLTQNFRRRPRVLRAVVAFVPEADAAARASLAGRFEGSAFGALGREGLRRRVVVGVQERGALVEVVGVAVVGDGGVCEGGGEACVEGVVGCLEVGGWVAESAVVRCGGLMGVGGWRRLC